MCIIHYLYNSKRDFIRLTGWHDLMDSPLLSISEWKKLSSYSVQETGSLRTSGTSDTACWRLPGPLVGLRLTSLHCMAELSGPAIYGGGSRNHNKMFLLKQGRGMRVHAFLLYFFKNNIRNVYRAF